MRHDGCTEMELVGLHAVFHHVHQNAAHADQALTPAPSLDETGVCRHDWRQVSSLGLLYHILNCLHVFAA